MYVYFVSIFYRVQFALEVKGGQSCPNYIGSKRKKKSVCLTRPVFTSVPMKLVITTL